MALAAVPDPPAVSDPARVKFVGMSTEMFEPPEYGAMQRFVVVARCTGIGHEDVKGKTVPYRKMQVLDIQPGAVVEVPKDPQLAMTDDLFAMGAADAPDGDR